jgi:N,N'-diacetyllegionaminate synthase
MVINPMQILKNFNFKTVNNTYVIAEIGINHGGSLKKAMEMVSSASRTGCDAVKFQTYISEKRAPKNHFPELYDIIKSCELSLSDFKKIKLYCDDLGVEFISTPFDEESIDFLNSIGMNIFKISSFDLINLKLISKIASLGKTNIISTGMGITKEIDNACKILSESAYCKNALLYCVSSYPTHHKDSNLISISYLKQRYKNFIIGLSDHTSDIKVPSYGVVLGAQIIEKHFKIDEDMDCVDQSVSITEKQMKNLVTDIRFIEEALGKQKQDLIASEKDAIKYRRKDTL